VANGAAGVEEDSEAFLLLGRQRLVVAGEEIVERQRRDELALECTDRTREVVVVDRTRLSRKGSRERLAVGLHGLEELDHFRLARHRHLDGV
jgi:hypothetical protein